MTAPTAHDIAMQDILALQDDGSGFPPENEACLESARLRRYIADLEATIARLTAPIAEDLLREVVERNAEVIRKYVPCTCDREHMEPWHQQGCLRYFNDCITTALNQHAEERRRLVAIEEAARNLRHVEQMEGRWNGTFITQAELDAALDKEATR